MLITDGTILNKNTYLRFVLKNTFLVFLGKKWHDHEMLNSVFNNSTREYKLSRDLRLFLIFIPFINISNINIG